MYIVKFCLDVIEQKPFSWVYMKYLSLYVKQQSIIQHKSQLERETVFSFKTIKCNIFRHCLLHFCFAGYILYVVSCNVLSQWTTISAIEITHIFLYYFRGMFTMCSYHPLPTEALPIPKLCLTGRAPPR